MAMNTIVLIQMMIALVVSDGKDIVKVYWCSLINLNFDLYLFAIVRFVIITVDNKISMKFIVLLCVLCAVLAKDPPVYDYAYSISFD